MEWLFNALHTLSHLALLESSSLVTLGALLRALHMLGNVLVLIFK